MDKNYTWTTRSGRCRGSTGRTGLAESVQPGNTAQEPRFWSILTAFLKLYISSVFKLNTQTVSIIFPAKILRHFLSTKGYLHEDMIEHNKDWMANPAPQRDWDVYIFYL